MSKIALALLAAFVLAGCGGGEEISHPPADIIYPGPEPVLNPEPPATIPPPQPSSLDVGCGFHFCMVDWDNMPDDGAIAVIYRNTADDFAAATEIGRSDYLVFTDEDVRPGTAYYYWVVFEIDGGRGPVSDPVSDSTATPFWVPEPRPLPEPEHEPLPELECPPQAGRLPFPFIQYYEAPRTLQVGVEQGSGGFYEKTPDPQGILRVALPLVGERGEFELRYGLLDDGAGAATLEAYLRKGLHPNGRGLISRFAVVPTVRVIGPGATQSDIELIRRAVDLINTALPSAWRLRITGQDSSLSFTDTFEWRLSTGVPCHHACVELEPNIIDIEVRPSATSAGLPVAGIAAVRHRDVLVGQDYRLWIENAYIQINASNYTLGGDETAVGIVAHELIHALGFVDHVPSSFASIMTGDYSYTDDSLRPLDREGLRARYGRLDVGDSPGDFGPWASTSWHIHGNGEHAAFGVALRNGYSEPYAYGYEPASDLAADTALSGTVTWDGLLLGFTPEGATVQGDAALSVTLGTLRGRADFSNLVWSPAGQTPADPAAAATWEGGRLGYTISVSGNTFHRTGGDSGSLQGAFFGEAHEGMGGTLERYDLTAGFGGSR